MSAVNPLMPVEMVSGVGLTDAELRATPVDVAGYRIQLISGRGTIQPLISVAVDDSTSPWPWTIQPRCRGRGRDGACSRAILMSSSSHPCGGEKSTGAGQRHRDLHWPGRPRHGETSGGELAHPAHERVRHGDHAGVRDGDQLNNIWDNCPPDLYLRGHEHQREFMKKMDSDQG